MASGSRRRRRFLLIILGLAALGVVGWKARPWIELRVRLHLAERAVEADRLDEAEERLDLLIIERPMLAWPKFLRAQVARKRGEITQAEELLQRAIELGLPVEQARPEHDWLTRPATSQEGRIADR